MKRLTSNISPYLMLLIPIFIALAVLLIYADSAVNEQDPILNASCIKIPDFNIIQLIGSIFLK